MNYYKRSRIGGVRGPMTPKYEIITRGHWSAGVGATPMINMISGVPSAIPPRRLFSRPVSSEQERHNAADIRGKTTDCKGGKEIGERVRYIRTPDHNARSHIPYEHTDATGTYTNGLVIGYNATRRRKDGGCFVDDS